jgi:hypothetical protein
MIRLHNFGTQLLAVASLLAGPVLAAEPEETHAAAALFPEFETVFHLNGPLVRDLNSHSRSRIAGALLTPGGELLAGLDAAGKRLRAAILSDSEAVLLGAKDFKPPSSLGSSSYRFCYIVIMATKSQLNVASLFHGLLTDSVTDEPLWRWSAKLFEESAPPTPVYATRVGQVFFLVANDIDKLRSVRERLRSLNDDPRTLNSIPDWEWVAEHQVWGYRRYSGDKAAEMPKVLFAVEPGGRECTVKLVGGQQPTKALLRLNRSGLFPTPVPAQAGVLELRLPLQENDQTLGKLFEIMWVLGFEIYL